jgi:cytochrome c peroxidase
MKSRSILICGSILLSFLIFFILLKVKWPGEATDPAKAASVEVGAHSESRVMDTNLPSQLPPRLLRTLALNPDGYDPTKSSFAAEVLLGDLLFHSPTTLGPKAQALGISCQTCHANGATNPEFFLPGISNQRGNADLSTAYFRIDADNGVADAVNIPTLRGARFTGPYGHDGRTSSLSEFINQVVVSEFDGKPLSPTRLRALVSYVQEFDFLPNGNLDSKGRLSIHAPQLARTGEDQFFKLRPAFRGESCASCHEPSSFFRDGKSHRHAGSGRQASPFSLDDAEETPTLLGTFETAPYFHDGRFATLDQVVEWYDKSYDLGLTTGQRSALLAYLKVIGNSEMQHDDRPMARKLVENFSLLVLLLRGQAEDDPQIWIAAIDEVTPALAKLCQVPEISARVNDMAAKLGRLREQCLAGRPLSELRSEAKKIHQELNDLAPGWAGVLRANK